MSREQQILTRARFCEWFSQSPGLSLRALEAHALRAVWPSLFGRVAVQLGSIGPVDLMDGCNAPIRTLYELPPARVGIEAEAEAPLLVYGMPEELPFDTRSVDIMLLPHTLDFVDDPHQVLRETSRVLTPEGHLVVLGFNPFSLWGLWRLVLKRRGHVPWCGRFLQLARLKDWLKLLDFEITHGSMFYYRPPLVSIAALERLRFLDQAGNRWWPLAGAVYLLVAKKRVVGMTPLRPEWRNTPAFGKAVARPALRVIRGG